MNPKDQKKWLPICQHCGRPGMHQVQWPLTLEELAHARSFPTYWLCGKFFLFPALRHPVNDYTKSYQP